MQQLISSTLENNNLLLLKFSDFWDQEDIAHLASLFFSKLPQARQLEHIQGADREYYRFTFEGSYLILHFECYSNACWLEAEDQVQTDAIADIASQLGH